MYFQDYSAVKEIQNSYIFVTIVSNVNVIYFYFFLLLSENRKNVALFNTVFQIRTKK